MLARDLVGQGQAQAGALGTTADQRQEQVFGQLLGHATAVVDDLHPQRARVQALADVQAAFHPGAQDDGRGTGLQRVADQVPDRLGQAVGVTVELRDARVVVALQAYRPATLGLGQAQHALEHGVDVQRRVRTLRGRRQQLLHQLVEAVDLGADQFDQLMLVASVGARMGPPRQQLGGTLESGQRIAQFVGHALERGLQGRRQRLGRIGGGRIIGWMRLQQPALGGAGQPAIGMPRRLAGHPQRDPVQAQHLALVLGQEPRQGIAFQLQRGQRLADQAPDPDPDPARERRIDASDPALAVGPGQRCGELVQGGDRGRGRLVRIHCTNLVQDAAQSDWRRWCQRPARTWLASECRMRRSSASSARPLSPRKRIR